MTARTAPLEVDRLRELVVGFLGEDKPVMLDRLLSPAQFGQRIAQVVVHLDLIWPHAQRGLVIWN